MVTPSLASKSFSCPHCRVVARQYKYSIVGEEPTVYNEALALHNPDAASRARIHLTRCEHCANFALWYRGKLVVPGVSLAPSPHSDMPEGVLVDYLEAAAILAASPRGAAA